jgi:hypothetical protein
MAVNPQIKTLDLRPPKAPNLLVAPIDYRQQYHDQMNNALRLYFNQIDNFAQGVGGNNGGAFLKFPYFSAYQNGNTTLTANMTNVSTTPIQVTSTANFQSSGFLLIGSELIQYTGKTSTTFTGITRGVKSTTNVAHTAGVAITEAAGTTVGTAAAMIIDTVTISNGITCTTPDSKVYFNSAGVYDIQFSAQLLNYTTSEDNVTVWFRKNGVDVPYSAGVQQVNAKHGTSPGAGITAWNYVDSFAAGDYFELYWHSDSGNTVLATYPAGTSPVHPISPSLILTVTFVSALY